MKIFIDSANVEDIAEAASLGVVDGVTTNPSLIAKEGADIHTRIRQICEIVDGPVSAEVVATAWEAMVEEGRELAAIHDNVVVKVPTGGYQAIDKNLDPFTGLKVINALWRNDIKVNATLIFNTTQAFWAANAGASYVSPFLGRLADYMYKHDHVEREPGNSLNFLEDHKAPAGGPLV